MHLHLLNHSQSETSFHDWPAMNAKQMIAQFGGFIAGFLTAWINSLHFKLWKNTTKEQPIIRFLKDQLKKSWTSQQNIQVHRLFWTLCSVITFVFPPDCVSSCWTSVFILSTLQAQSVFLFLVWVGTRRESQAWTPAGRYDAEHHSLSCAHGHR